MERFQQEQTDVLIIGAGAAGTRAAISSAENGTKTILVTKGPFGKSGITPVGFEGFSGNFDQPGDSPEFHLEEVVRSGKFLCDQDVAAVMVQEAMDAIQYCDALGVKFSKRDSAFEPFPTPGCKVPRLLKLWGGGMALLSTLKKKVEEFTAYPSIIDVREDTLISKILVRDGRVYGAIGLDLKKGVVRLFHCKALVLAGGGAGHLWRHSDCPPESTGDAFALAAQAGVKVVNMEQQLFYPTVGLFPPAIKGLEISYEWCLNKEHPELGGWLLNSKNAAFYPENEVGTRDFITHVMEKEVVEGRGTSHGGVYLDVTGVSEERKELIRRMNYSYKRLLQLGVDLLHEKIEVAPAAHTTLGGVKIETDCGTNVPGFFACGEATGNVHGANRLAGHSYLDTQVFGARAGRSAAEFAKDADWLPIADDEVKSEYTKIFSHLGWKTDGIAPCKLKEEIVQLVGTYLGPIRDGKGLTRCVNEIESVEVSGLPRMDAPETFEYNYDWAECIEVSLMCDCAKMVAKSALARNESRGTHFRKDFPLTDNVNPVQHTVVWLTNGRMEVTSEDVKLGKFQPTREKIPPF